jgi:hypothetical protein
MATFLGDAMNAAALSAGGSAWRTPASSGLSIGDGVAVLT